MNDLTALCHSNLSVDQIANLGYSASSVMEKFREFALQIVTFNIYNPGNFFTSKGKSIVEEHNIKVIKEAIESKSSQSRADIKFNECIANLRLNKICLSDMILDNSPSEREKIYFALKLFESPEKTFISSGSDLIELLNQPKKLSKISKMIKEIAETSGISKKELRHILIQALLGKSLKDIKKKDVRYFLELLQIRKEQRQAEINFLKEIWENQQNFVYEGEESFDLGKIYDYMVGRSNLDGTKKETNSISESFCDDYLQKICNLGHDLDFEVCAQLGLGYVIHKGDTPWKSTNEKIHGSFISFQNNKRQDYVDKIYININPSNSPELLKLLLEKINANGENSGINQLKIVGPKLLNRTEGIVLYISDSVEGDGSAAHNKNQALKFLLEIKSQHPEYFGEQLLLFPSFQYARGIATGKDPEHGGSYNSFVARAIAKVLADEKQEIHQWEDILTNCKSTLERLIEEKSTKYFLEQRRLQRLKAQGATQQKK
jgi:hypothetical protein